MHRAVVRTLNLIQREHGAFERFQARERHVHIFSLGRSLCPQIGGDKTQTRETSEESVDKCRCEMIIAE